MRDAVLTIRLPRATRARIETLAASEGRSLSQQVVRLVELGFQAREAGRIGEDGRPFGRRSIAGVLAGGLVPTLENFREVRDALCGSLRERGDAEPVLKTPTEDSE